MDALPQARSIAADHFQIAAQPRGLAARQQRNLLGFVRSRDKDIIADAPADCAGSMTISAV